MISPESSRGMLMRCGWCALLLCSLSGPALAASVTPTTVEPGLIEQQFKQTEIPSVSPEPLISVPKESASPIIADGPEFTMTTLTITGSTVFSEEELRSFYADKLGQKVQLADVQAIAASITSAYHEKGYVLSRAIVPQQRVSDGVVAIQVLEGYVDDVKFEGADENILPQLKDYAARITKARPLDAGLLERMLLLMDDLPGTAVNAVLTPSPTEQGAAELVVQVTQKSYEGEATFDNRGSRYLGPLQLGARVAENSLLGQAEQFQLRSVASGNLDELRYYEGSYRQPLGDDGASLQLRLSRTETRPGNALEILDILGTSNAVGVDVSYPFVRSRRENLIGSVGIDARNTRSEVLDTEIYRDHIRTLNVGGQLHSYDALGGLHFLSGSLVKGLEVIDSSEKGDTLSRANADPNSTKLEGQYNYEYPLPENFSVFFSAAGQYSLDPLVASEEFSLGGEGIGSAYDAAEIAGDSGAGARMELRYQDMVQDAWIPYYQVYGFYDGGKVWNRDVLPSEKKGESLTSTGVGARMSLPYGLSASVEISKPLTHKVVAEGSGGKDTRGFFSIIAPF